MFTLMVVNVKIIIKELNVSVIVHLVFTVGGFTESNKSLTQIPLQHQATLQLRKGGHAMWGEV